MNASLLPSLAVAALAVAASAAHAQEASAGDERVTRTSEGFAGDHAADELRNPNGFETTRRPAADIPQKPRVAVRSKAFSSTKSAYGDTYVYDATTDLFSDHDGDGYFHHLRVRLDADTLFTSSVVYAQIYVSADGKAWELLYTTKNFTVFGSNPDDDYEIEADLVSGYSTGQYDVLIELHDAADSTLLDEYGPSESPEFSVLPLEDSARDGIVEDSGGHGGGGAVSWLMLPGLLGALLLKRWRRPAAGAPTRG
ncbi:MAG: choice-of-anchor H family protein [Gammaproteobacteria bacterium]